MRRLVSLPHFIVMKMLEFVLSYMIKINMILSFGFWFLFCPTPFSVAARAKCIVLPRRNWRRQGWGQWRNITSGGSMLCEIAALACYVEAKGVLTGEGTSCQQRFWVANICLIRGLALTLQLRHLWNSFLWKLSVPHCPWPAAISVYIHLSFNYLYFPLVQRVFGAPKIAVAAWLIDSAIHIIGVAVIM